MSASARPLGLVGATALVVGNMIGSGTFLLPAALAPYGDATLAGWAISFTGALLLAAVFARLASRWPRAGGPYAYARAAFGDGAGFATGWLYWLSIVCGNAAIAVAFAGSLGALVPALGATPARSAACAIAALWLCTASNLAGLRTAGAVQVSTVVVKVFALVAIAIAGAWALGTGANEVAPSPPAPGGSTPLSLAATTAALTLWAFLGLECATVPAHAVRDAVHTVPRATWIGTIVAGLVTVVACTVVLKLVPADALARSGAPFAEAARLLHGDGAARALAAAGAIACFGTLNGWVLMQGELPAAIARDGLFPAAFARANARGAPAFALLAGSLVATALIAARAHGTLVALFTASILVSTAATLVPYLVCAAASARDARRLAQPLAFVVALLALAYSAWALYGTGRESLAWGAGAALVGAAVFRLRPGPTM